MGGSKFEKRLTIIRRRRKEQKNVDINHVAKMQTEALLVRFLTIFSSTRYLYFSRKGP